MLFIGRGNVTCADPVHINSNNVSSLFHHVKKNLFVNVLAFLFFLLTLFTHS